MRVAHHKARFTPGVSGIDAQEDRLDPSVAEMLVDQMTLPKNLYF